MQPNIHKSERHSGSRVRVAVCLLGSIYTSATALVGAAHAKPIAQIDNGRSLDKLTTNTRANPLDGEAVPQSHRTAIGIPKVRDLKGHWAEPFVTALLNKDIVRGYADGTFRPDRAVTRAEFAAILNQAFALQPQRAARQLKDLPANYWAKDAIQAAYQSGFIAADPDGSFAPDRPILRIQSLVALVAGNQFKPAKNLDLKTVYGDVDRIPSYGLDALVAATQKCLVVSADYDSSKLPTGNFGANTVATRADVAAYIHQALVAAGKLPALDKTSPANRYIASCPQGIYATQISDTTPRVAVASENDKANDATANMRVNEPLPPTIAKPVNAAYPVNALTTPTAFGSSWGSAFVGTSYQSTSRGGIYSTATSTAQSRQDGAAYFGFGFGDERDGIGVETVVTSYSTLNSSFFRNGSASFKLHKQFSDNLAIAGGIENAISWPNGVVDGGTTGYGVASLVLNPDPNVGFLSNTTLSIGGGAGRFRSIGDIRSGKGGYGVFGSVGTRLSPNFSLVADWNGQDLNIGLPITVYLSDSSTIQLVPAAVDLVNRETGGPRWIINGGVGFRF